MKNLENLSSKELTSVNGGEGFWYDVAYAALYVTHAIVYMGQVGGAYQQSLPSSLKK